jgi:hypothetical protein
MTTTLASTLTAAPVQALTVTADPPTGSFLEGLKPYTALPLVIAYSNRETRAGYHVTEVRSGRFSALDCGGNPEAWSETFIQVWDVPGEPQSRMMTVGKFLAIMDKVADNVGLDRDSRLTFECGDDVGVIGLYAVEGVTAQGWGRSVQCLFGRKPAQGHRQPIRPEGARSPWISDRRLPLEELG